MSDLISAIPSAQTEQIGTQMSLANCISRKAAIDAIVAWTVEDRPDIEMPTDLVRRINALPSAQPEITQKDVELYCRQRYEIEAERREE